MLRLPRIPIRTTRLLAGLLLPFCGCVHSFANDESTAAVCSGQPSATDETSPPADSKANTKLTQVTLRGSEAAITGRVVQRAGDGSLLLEDRAGQLHVCLADQIKDVSASDEDFRPLTRDEMATHLLQQTGGGFVVQQTEHFVICSNASELYTDYCGRLLEKVVREYVELMTRLKIQLQPLPKQLPVIIFRRSEGLQQHASRQHPNVSFADVPGYYSMTFNQMLVAGLSGDRTFTSRGDVVRELKTDLRQVETIVHEAVHQLAFNSGLQVRMADNPMWFSEGLAVYFEHANGSGNALWSGPGGVNRIHRPGFVRAVVNEEPVIPLEQLVTSDAVFQSDDPTIIAAAYAESWALVYHLIRRQPDSFSKLATTIQHRLPLVPVSQQQRLQAFHEALPAPLPEVERDLIRSIGRLKVR